MTISNQILNAVSAEVAAIRTLYDTTFELKAVRAKLQLLGATALPADAVFPGDLSHVTPAKLTAMFAAMDALDAAFLTPNAAGVPPIKALVDMIP